MSRLDELDVVIRRKGGRIVAGIPSIRLYATADNTAAALEALDVKKRAYEADLDEAGLSESIEISDQATGVAAAKPVRGELRMVALKSVIVIGLIAVGVVVVANLLVSRIEESFDRTIFAVRAQLAPLANTKIGGREVWAKIETEIERAARPGNDLDPERQQKLLANIRAIVNRARPFAAEIAPLFAELRAPDGQPPAQNCK